MFCSHSRGLSTIRDLLFPWAIQGTDHCEYGTSIGNYADVQPSSVSRNLTRRSSNLRTHPMGINQATTIASQELIFNTADGV